LLTSGPTADAIFCVNDLMAFGALDHLRSTGLGVPDDVSVIGFDDVPIAAWASYRLTTLRQDPRRIAREVVSTLDRRIADPDTPPISVYLPVELVIRETVKTRR
jgi:DNA-binding LacI/PurR family transcriptional regulator